MKPPFGTIAENCPTCRGWRGAHAVGCSDDSRKEVDQMTASVAWERIYDSSGELERARIPGGWLVKVVSHIDGGQLPGTHANIDSWVASICFVPDSDGTWGMGN